MSSLIGAMRESIEGQPGRSESGTLDRRGGWPERSRRVMRDEAMRPAWFSTLLSSIESSISRCIAAHEDPAAVEAIAAAIEPEEATLVLPLSARTPEELDNLIWWWANVLEDERVSVSRSCATAALRRHHPHRVAVVASRRETFLAGLRAIAEARLVLWCEPGANPALVRTGVLHVRGKWVDWRAVYGSERHRLFAERRD